MKRITSKFTFLAIAGLTLSAALAIQSCSKSDSGSGITPIGGYTSSDAVASESLVGYWPFDGNSNEKISGNTATASGVTYTTGIRGQAYQGATGAYATLVPSNAIATVNSFALSVWFNLATQQADGNPGGMFFLSGTSNLNDMLLEAEHYSPVSGDSVKIHHGFTDLISTGYQGFTMESYDTMAIGKWVHLVMCYDAGSSTYTFYQNGSPRGVSSAWSGGTYVTPTTMYNGPLPVGSGTPPTAPLGNNSFFSTTTPQDSPQKIYIGTWPPTLYGVSATLGSNGCFNGQMDELRIYSRALSPAEVAGLYLNGKAGR